jgi:mevalonate kinase
LKKFGKILALTLAALMLLSTTALAEDITDTDSASVSPSKENNVTVKFNDESGASMTVTYTNDSMKAGDQYLILMVMSGAKSINEDSILYINQETAKADENDKVSVTFDTVYPSSLLSGDILIAGTGTSGALTAATVTVKYTLGDVDDSGEIDALDAMLTAQHAISLPITGKFIEEAADVDGNEIINALDAMTIAQYAIGLISGFSNAN